MYLYACEILAYKDKQKWVGKSVMSTPHTFNTKVSNLVCNSYGGMGGSRVEKSPKGTRKKENEEWEGCKKRRSARRK